MGEEDQMGTVTHPVFSLATSVEILRDIRCGRKNKDLRMKGGTTVRVGDVYEVRSGTLLLSVKILDIREYHGINAVLDAEQGRDFWPSGPSDKILFREAVVEYFAVSRPDINPYEAEFVVFDIFPLIERS